MKLAGSLTAQHNKVMVLEKPNCKMLKPFNPSTFDKDPNPPVDNS